MSVRAIEAEVSIKSGVQAECSIGREVIVEVHDDVNLEALTATANGSYRPESGVDGWDRVTVSVPERQPVTEPLSVTANGSYEPAVGVDGFSDVTVNVPERIPVTESLTVTQNGLYEPTEGIDGYDRVSVAVPERVPVTESLTVTQNGNYTPSGGVDGFSSVSVSVPERQPDIESLTATSNGTYTSGKDGYNPVVVAVPPSVPDIDPLTVTEDGTYTASGDGYNPVTVNTGVESLRQEIASAETASGCSPLTDCITALTRYANEVTGQEDETLSDAVTRLVAGYGGGGIENGVEIKAVDSSGRPTSIVFYGGAISTFLLGSKSKDDFCFSYVENISLKDVIESIGMNAFSYFGSKRTNSEDMEIIFSSGLTTIDAYAFSSSGFTKLSFPETLTGRLSDNVFRGALKLKEVVLPGITSLNTSGGNGNGQFYGCTALENVQVGSVGHGVTSVSTWTFRNCTQTTLIITLYTTGSLVDEHLTKLRDSSYGATGATIIFKASEATTYNGNSYAAGATILTSTPNS